MNKLIITVKATGQKAEVKPFNISENIYDEQKFDNGAITAKYKNSDVYIDKNGNICFFVN